MYEKILVALVRTKDRNCEQTFPIAFKMPKNEIPRDFIPLEMHPHNLIEIKIEGVNTVPAMIVVIGGKRFL